MPHVTRHRLAGIAIGSAVAWIVGSWDPLGRGLLLAAPAFGLVVLGAVLLSETLVNRPSAPIRKAALARRRARDYLPARLGWAVGSAAALLGVVGGATTAVGRPDDLGRAGRSLTVACGVDTTVSQGPWPGSYYTAPLGIAVAAGLLVAGIALSRVVNRPRDGDAVADDVARHASGTAIVAACGLVVSIPLAGLAFISAIALDGIDDCGAAMANAQPALLVVAFGAVALAAVCLGSLVVPAGSGVRRSYPAEGTSSRGTG